MRTVTWLAVAAGGALGSVARFGVQLAVERTAGRSLPLATALVNIAGCVVIGILAGALSAQRVEWSAEARAFAMAGVLGGFTTFSSLGLDTLGLVQEGRAGTAIVNVALQVGVGLLGLAAGYAAMRAA